MEYLSMEYLCQTFAWQVERPWEENIYGSVCHPLVLDLTCKCGGSIVGKKLISSGNQNFLENIAKFPEVPLWSEKDRNQGLRFQLFFSPTTQGRYERYTKKSGILLVILGHLLVLAIWAGRSLTVAHWTSALHCFFICSYHHVSENIANIAILSYFVGHLLTMFCDSSVREDMG